MLDQAAGLMRSLADEIEATLEQDEYWRALRSDRAGTKGEMTDERFTLGWYGSERPEGWSPVGWLEELEAHGESYRAGWGQSEGPLGADLRLSMELAQARTGVAYWLASQHADLRLQPHVWTGSSEVSRALHRIADAWRQPADAWDQYESERHRALKDGAPDTSPD
jgi:hypothetical protein